MRKMATMLAAMMLMAAPAPGQQAARKSAPAPVSAHAKERARNRAAVAARERAAARAQAEAMSRAQAEYRAMLPYLMEQRKQELDRLGAMERNAALHRMAAAAEAEARIDKQRADQEAWFLYSNRPR